ncbi:MAG TPA: hypothetical protein PK864_10330 [Syntrophorhabdaceae bacterium]|nr:hypothetical protein [Syntrophorhabdaceae bacterium]HOL06208.1 hypothetical protein [Syntrophorhabdaceae bacterium]HON86401.1 hypothetical protein [Syntrophorhabdaceae bacterium]HOT42967.1 hypothetical protein [Syntrophorhabdaceae bacterium]HPP40982.1 hypothetical protein [Syntrophorhabdaceae bacterium]
MKEQETKMGMGMGMMSEMMQNMMQNMMKGGGNMPEMMQNMMKGNMSMPEMCMKMMEQMAGSMNESAKAASYATPEMRTLFEEWLKNLETEVVEFVKEKGKTTPSDIAAKLKVSTDSVIFLIAKLTREGKLTIGEIKVA